MERDQLGRFATELKHYLAAEQKMIKAGLIEIPSRKTVQPQRFSI